MRVLRLGNSDADKRTFQHLYAAVRSGEVRGIEQIRRVGKILDKLEAIGVKEHRTQVDPETQEPVAGWRWRLADNGGELWLEDAEFGELQSRMNGVAWHPDAARFVARTFELLDSAPEEDPTKPRPTPAELRDADRTVASP